MVIEEGRNVVEANKSEDRYIIISGNDCQN